MMKKAILILFVLSNLSCSNSNSKPNPKEEKIEPAKIQADLEEILTDISQNYIYLKDKKVDIDCLRDYYSKQIENLKNEDDVILFFEYLLDELYDSHVTLNTNLRSSYRLHSPIYATLMDGKPIITQLWQTRIEGEVPDLVGAEIQKFNGEDFDAVIEAFPTHCNDKNSPEVREWIVNKILSGRYNEPRELTLMLSDGNTLEFDLDKLALKKNEGLLTSRVEDGIGIIRLNNSLGENVLISEFDATLSKLMDTDGLILDLRNTVGGGNSFVARGIMSRFVTEDLPYQKHVVFDENWDNQPEVGRSWVEYVSPRGTTYTKPVVVLVGRWTGSMGEGLTIGFEGMERGEVVGTEMERLAGAMFDFGMDNQDFGYKLSMEKLYHVNGTPREKYVPTHYVKQTTTQKDETLEEGMELIRKMNQ